MVGGSVEDYPNGVPICAFCEDGVPCPKSRDREFPGVRDRIADKEPAAAVAPEKPAARRGLCQVEGCDRKPGTKSEARYVPGARASAHEASMGQSSDQSGEAAAFEEANVAKICAKEGCGKELTDRNSTGYCTAHFYLSKTGGEEKHCGCGRKIRRDCKSGVCGVCRAKKEGVAPPKQEASLVTRPRAAAVPAAPAKAIEKPTLPGTAVINLRVTESQLDRMFTMFPLSRKVDLVQSELSRLAAESSVSSQL